MKKILISAILATGLATSATAGGISNVVSEPVVAAPKCKYVFIDEAIFWWYGKCNVGQTAVDRDGNSYVITDPGVADPGKPGTGPVVTDPTNPDVDPPKGPKGPKGSKGPKGPKDPKGPKGPKAEKSFPITASDRAEDAARKERSKDVGTNRGPDHDNSVKEDTDDHAASGDADDATDSNETKAPNNNPKAAFNR